jgi:hypothetical protein
MGESVLSRAVRILEAFTPDEPALTVSEISRRTELHLATASRLVAELVSHGFLTRDADRQVRIGVRLWELGTRASPTQSLRDAAMPFMEGVHDVVGHHVQIGVLEGDEVLFLERLTAPGAIINYTRVAGRLPPHVSSSVLVLLAHGPVGLQEQPLLLRERSKKAVVQRALPAPRPPHLVARPEPRPPSHGLSRTAPTPPPATRPGEPPPAAGRRVHVPPATPGPAALRRRSHPAGACWTSCTC